MPGAFYTPASFNFFLYAISKALIFFCEGIYFFGLFLICRFAGCPYTISATILYSQPLQVADTIPNQDRQHLGFALSTTDGTIAGELKLANNYP